MVSKTSVILLGIVMLCGSTFAGNWVGGVNDSWFAPGNWSPNSIPTLGDAVLIEKDAPIGDVVISGAAASAHSVRIAKHSLTVQSGGSLTVGQADGDQTSWMWIGWGNFDYGILNIGTGTTLTCTKVDHGYGEVNVKGGHLVIHGAGVGSDGQFYTSMGAAQVTSVSLTDGGSINLDAILQIGNTGTTVFDMNSGTLTSGGGVNIGCGSQPGHGTMNMRGGTINSTGPIYCGLEGIGVLTMTGGTINCGSVLAIGPYPTATGTVYLKNGQINVSNFTMGIMGGTALLDIENGQITVAGDLTSRINGYVSNGWIKAFGGKGVVVVKYDAGSNVTTVSGLNAGAANPVTALYSAGVPFNLNSHIVSASVFHWYTTNGGQLTGPWLPLEGRGNWTGEPYWWQSQIKQMMAANIDVLYVHSWPGASGSLNLFTALGQLRAKGYNVPKIVPFLDLAITSSSFNLATTTGKDEFVNQYALFFNNYFAANTDQYAESYLAVVDGRVALDNYLNSTLVNPGSLTRQDVASRLAAAFGTSHPVFNNGIYMIENSVSNAAFAWADEKVSQFGTTVYYLTSLYNGVTSAQVKGGYWDQNIRTPGSFLARNGGSHYHDAWSSVHANSNIHRVYIESWNEYDEGSGIYAANTGAPYIKPPNPNTDTWSSTNDPFEYIKTTAAGARQFNDCPDLDSKILWNSIPLCMEAGKQYTASVVVRNRGDLLWNEANQFRFSQNETISGETLFGAGGQTRWTIDDVNNEVSFYGGVFRGRPVTFVLNLRAPATPGTYVTHWGMLLEGTGRFGEQMVVTIKVASPDFSKADMNGDCQIDLADLAILAQNWLVCNRNVQPACP